MLPAPPRPVEALVLERIGEVEVLEVVLVEAEDEDAGATRMVLPAPPRPVWMRWFGGAVGWGSVIW
jgi:hypothetical protein